MRGRRGRGWLKNPYKGEKRKTGWGDSFEGRSSGERREREEGGRETEEKGKKDRAREKERCSSRVCAFYSSSRVQAPP